MKMKYELKNIAGVALAMNTLLFFTAIGKIIYKTWVWDSWHIALVCSIGVMISMALGAFLMADGY
jgi:uncharacterized membrane protein YfcA